MTLLATAILLATISVGYDFAVSFRRAKKYGLASELNPAISRLAPHVGLRSAMLSWTLVPHLMFTVVATYFDWRLAYAFYTGFVVKQALIQLASVPLERQIDEAIGASRLNPPANHGRRPDDLEGK